MENENPNDMHNKALGDTLSAEDLIRSSLDTGY